MIDYEAPLEQPEAANMRSFGLNSAEAYEALCPRQDRPSILNGALPRTPKVWDRPAIVDFDRTAPNGAIARDKRPILR